MGVRAPLIQGVLKARLNLRTFFSSKGASLSSCGGGCLLYSHGTCFGCVMLWWLFVETTRLWRDGRVSPALVQMVLGHRRSLKVKRCLVRDGERALM